MGRKQCPLLSSIRKAILLLNNTLPQNIACIWITAEELHDRLVFAGDKRALKPAMVVDALRLHTTDGCSMAKRVHNSVNYYQSKTVHLSDLTNSGPCKQQIKKTKTGLKNRMQTSRTNYFIDARNRHLDVINDALTQLEQKETERIERERSKRFIHVLIY